MRGVLFAKATLEMSMRGRKPFLFGSHIPFLFNGAQTLYSHTFTFLHTRSRLNALLIENINKLSTLAL